MRASSVDQIILDTLSKENAHLTSHQVYEEIRERLPAVNQSTIYRALERLANCGKVSISDMGSGSAVFELVTGRMHHHLVCQRCNQVFTIGDEQVRNFFSVLQSDHNFEITTNHLILFGICEKCRNNDLESAQDN